MARDIPELLRKIRLMKGISQEGASDVVGLSPKSYGRYERGETEISFTAVVKLASFYGLTLDEFYNFGEPKYIVSEPHNELETLKQEVQSLREQNDLLKQLSESKDKLLNKYRQNATSKKDVAG